ncbi:MULTISPECIES: hypothetical protein [Pseudonocardia]|uniref:Uncharacterized protein n=2 Tax=Pseudonocardia TaxID=1847 RepID=A0A1Y2MYQ8_PSEAH|nr:MULTISPECIES: hypothetical protein [Pseudonocardia]OSY40313.1 hypothetical protein BG845_02716 [Pseudonocardia autotrophica]TDN72358.1 hypothetical protein C8E95_1414 [Pseudonocardia autotrophica]BBG03068.1 hypothetical protein Pdca_42770 [Pseudonocardia autotrophica]GEC23690.1 hypothetical protein PSA01_07190 [Pseudonocardia saturnea]
MTGLSTRGLWVVVAVLALLAFGAVWVAGSGPPPPATTSTGSIRLGPEPGQDVEDYLASLPAQLPQPGPAVPALVQLDRPHDVPGAAALTGTGTVGTAIFRVPLERVQTALRFEHVLGTGDPAAAIDVAREQAAFRAEAELDRAGRAETPDAGAVATRRAEILAVEARRLADRGCACVIGLVVTADRAGLEEIAGTDGVRAVHAAPPGSSAAQLALAPLLPEQRSAATPPPDDGPVPTG